MATKRVRGTVVSPVQQRLDLTGCKGGTTHGGVATLRTSPDTGGIMRSACPQTWTGGQHAAEVSNGGVVRLDRHEGVLPSSSWFAPWI